MESGDIQLIGDRYEYRGDANSITIPATLRDSLTARLDRSAAIKEVAQIGAAIGREFRYELIQAVAEKSQAELDAALMQLTNSGLAFRRGTPPEAVYTFKHALVRTTRAQPRPESSSVGTLYAGPVDAGIPGSGAAHV